MNLTLNAYSIHKQKNAIKIQKKKKKMQCNAYSKI